MLRLYETRNDNLGVGVPFLDGGRLLGGRPVLREERLPLHDAGRQRPSHEADVFRPDGLGNVNFFRSLRGNFRQSGPAGPVFSKILAKTVFFLTFRSRQITNLRRK